MEIHSFPANGFAVYTHSYSLTLIYVCSTIRLLNQAGRNSYPYNPKFVGNTGNRTRDLWLDERLQNSDSRTEGGPAN